MLHAGRADSVVAAAGPGRRDAGAGRCRPDVASLAWRRGRGRIGAVGRSLIILLPSFFFQKYSFIDRLNSLESMLSRNESVIELFNNEGTQKGMWKIETNLTNFMIPGI